MPSRIISQVKRGDTLIEVMIAFAILSLVSIVTVTTMNMGVATNEQSLELVTARSELNAQAEALRFIHSSYISELTLPRCSEVSAGEKCQQYRDLWIDLTSESHTMVSSASLSAPNRLTIEYPLMVCSTAYDDSSPNSLYKNRAFVINTRQLLAHQNLAGGSISYLNTDAVIRARASDDPNNLFTAAPLNARIIYSTQTGQDGEDGGSNSTGDMRSPVSYTRVARVEGIWVIAVRGPDTAPGHPQYYDFYIQTCWYGPSSKAPTSLDTIIRLYNPENT